MALFEEALALAENEGDSPLVGEILRDRGISLLRQGAYADARADFRRSIDLFDEIGEAVEAGETRLHLATSVHGSGDHENGWFLLEEARAAFEEAGAEDKLHFAEIVAGRCLVNEGDFRGAIEELNKAEAFFSAEGNEPRLTDLSNLKAYALQQLGEWREAKQGYERVLDLAFRRGRQDLVAYAYCNLGDVEAELGSSGVAEESVDRSMEILEKIRTSISGGPEERLTYLDAQISAYHRKISLLVDRKDPRGALAVAERFHAKAFLEQLDRPPAAALPGDEDREAADALLELQRKLLREGLSPEEREQLREREADWARRERERRRETEAEPEPVTQVDLDELQRALPDQTAYLTYWVHPERTFLWVVLRGRIELIQVPVTSERMGQLVHDYLGPIESRVRAEDVALRGKSLEHLQTGHELYRLLIEPAVDLLAGTRHLIISPDAELWYLPFEALVRDLPDPASDTSRSEPLFFEYAAASFLAERFSMLYAHSATVWTRLGERPVAESGFLAVAPTLDGSSTAKARGWTLPPLPEAQREAEELRALFRDGAALLGEKATESTVKRRTARRRWVHFAAHGYLHEERPELSGLFLWPADESAENGDDGLLQAHEVRRVGWSSELVSLAVCNSALGQLSRGEGLVGLARSILVSGSRNVLVSLWPVDDRATGDLMRRFYGTLRGGETLPGALQSAKLALGKRTSVTSVVTGDERVSYAHPYFWAPFVLIGGDSLSPFPGGERATRGSTE